MLSQVESPFDPGYFSEKELFNLGFKNIGKNVRIAKNCIIRGIENIVIGDHVRIDGYTEIFVEGRGFLKLGSFVHVAGSVNIFADEGVIMEDFSGISHGVKIYTVSRKHQYICYVSPSVDLSEHENFKKGQVHLGKHVVIGANTVVMPNVIIGEGTSVGAYSLIASNLDPWGVYCGIPVKKIKNRLKDIMDKEKMFLKKYR